LVIKNLSGEERYLSILLFYDRSDTSHLLPALVNRVTIALLYSCDKSSVIQFVVNILLSLCFVSTAVALLEDAQTLKASNKDIARVLSLFDEGESLFIVGYISWINMIYEYCLIAC